MGQQPDVDAAESLRPYYVDLHVHTVLSPCASYDMVPTLIVKRAREVGLDILAVTDHNSSENAAAVMTASAGSGLTVLPGMEVETREEVHLLVIFQSLEEACAWQQIVYRHLPNLPNREEFFGVQLVVDAEDQLVCKYSRRLLMATTMPLQQVTEEVGRLGGLCIASHVDRPSYSVIGSLGFVPPEADIPALEISRHAVGRECIRRQFFRERTAVQFSDAHNLSELGSARTLFHLAEPTVAELRLACRAQQGRRAQLTCPMES